MIIIDVTLIAHPGTADALRALLLNLQDASSAEQGCLTYRCSADLLDVQKFYLIEMWEDEESLKAHIAGEAFRHFIASLSAFGGVVSSVRRIGDMTPYEMPKANQS